MDVKIINIFASTCSEILSQMAGIELKKEKLFTRTENIETNTVIIFLGLTGIIRGTVAFGMSEEDAMKISSKLMGGMEVNAIDEMTASALQEIGNIIMGHVASKLAKEGYEVDITPPTLLTGENIKIFQNNKPIVCIVFSTNINTYFEVAIRFEENS